MYTDSAPASDLQVEKGSEQPRIVGLPFAHIIDINQRKPIRQTVTAFTNQIHMQATGVSVNINMYHLRVDEFCRFNEKDLNGVKIIDEVVKRNVSCIRNALKEIDIPTYQTEKDTSLIEEFCDATGRLITSVPAPIAGGFRLMGEVVEGLGQGGVEIVKMGKALLKGYTSLF